MHETGILTHFQVRRQRAQEIHVVRGQHTFMIFKRAARIAVKRLKRNSADHRDIMIPSRQVRLGISRISSITAFGSGP